MSLPRARATQIVSDLGLSIDDLTNSFEDICWARGAYVQYAPLERAEARITMNGDRAIITANPEGIYKTRLRFAVAHELGHFELHRKLQLEFNCDRYDMNEWFAQQDSKRREIEANEFAAELLLPTEFFKPDIVTAKPSLKLLETLSEKYHTSLTATARRFIDLTPEACALVIFDRNRILCHWRSKFFSDQGYFVNPGKLNALTYAFDAAQGKPVPDYMSSVDVTSWFEVRSYLADETIKEQSKFSPIYDKGMALLWIDRGRLIVQ